MKFDIPISRLQLVVLRLPKPDMIILTCNMSAHSL